MLYTVNRVRAEWHTCSLCNNRLKQGQLMAVGESGKLAHYDCAKDRGWKRKSRAKKQNQPIKREIAPANRPIKVIKHYER